MRIVPAVDIRGGLCVNLVRGEYDRETVFSDDPVDQAQQWHRQGGELIHIVDLDGAKAGRCCIQSQLEALAAAGIPFEVGGGIRTMEVVETLTNLGAERIILGTAAHQDPDFLAAATKAFPGRVVVGIDGNARRVALSAWLEVTDTDVIEFARQVEQAGACRIIFTDILSDGMMKGPNLETTMAVADAVRIPVTASGGISSLEDIRAAHHLEGHGIDEVIVGRALYLNAFTLEEAMAVAMEPIVH